MDTKTARWMVRLDEMARTALAEYNAQIAAGSEPVFPDWIADLRAAIGTAERLADELADARQGLEAATMQLDSTREDRDQLLSVANRLLADHKRTPHHADLCGLCRDARAAGVKS